jgi:hypothetical protein
VSKSGFSEEEKRLFPKRDKKAVLSEREVFVKKTHLRSSPSSFQGASFLPKRGAPLK